LAAIEALPNSHIGTSDIAEMGDAFFSAARLVLPPQAGKRAISLRVDEDVLAFFRAEGKGHLSRMNAVLRAYMLAQKGAKD
jgi:uncharacterized protein (DUF4415 family)